MADQALAETEINIGDAGPALLRLKGRQDFLTGDAEDNIGPLQRRGVEEMVHFGRFEQGHVASDHRHGFIRLGRLFEIVRNHAGLISRKSGKRASPEVVENIAALGQETERLVHADAFQRGRHFFGRADQGHRADGSALVQGGDHPLEQGLPLQGQEGLVGPLDLNAAFPFSGQDDCVLRAHANFSPKLSLVPKNCQWVNWGQEMSNFKGLLPKGRGTACRAPTAQNTGIVHGTARAKSTR